MGVTDHAEYVGVTKEANTPGSAISKLPEAQPLILKDPNNKEEVNKVFLYLLSLTSKPPIKAFMSPQVAGTIWKDNVRLADENNHPGKFTAFCSFEYTSQVNNRNLHRNIFFRDCAKVPELPYSMLDSWHPEDLWKWMDTQRKAGNELLAISHNANLSDGWMYPTDVDSYGRPIDATWAASRDRNERLVEITQIKGQSETHPVLSPTDEFANYEIFVGLLGLPPDNGRVDHITGSFARQALKDGITLQDVRGYNPYKFGMAAGLGLAQHRQPVPPGQLLRWPRGDRRHGSKASGRGDARQHHRFTPGEQRRTDRRMGRGEHPRLDLGRDVPQGNLRRQRPAHQGAPVRRLGLQQGHPERQGLGAPVLCQRRAHGRGSAVDAVRRPVRRRRSSSGR